MHLHRIRSTTQLNRILLNHYHLTNFNQLETHLLMKDNEEICFESSHIDDESNALDKHEEQHAINELSDDTIDVMDDVKIKSVGVTQYYINQVSRFTLIDGDEEKRLSRLALQGDITARNKLINANLRLVVKISRRYMYRGLELADLIEEGNLGLMRAIEKFDPDKGFRFSTYGTWWIRQFIEKAIIDQGGLIRVPAYLARSINQRKRAERSFTQKEHRKASVKELSKSTHQDSKDIYHQLTYDIHPVSIHNPIGIGNDNTILDTLEDKSQPKPDELTHNEIAIFYINESLDQLDERERHVIRYRFGLDRCPQRSLESIASDFGISREHTRKIEASALCKLKGFMRNKGCGFEALIGY